MKILIVFGTRPEAIKMAPLVLEFKKYPHIFETVVCVTGQHRQMLDQVMNLFEIKPDYDLNIMKSGQDLYDITSQVLLGLRDILKESKPDVVFVHGDTSTSTATALAAFYQKIPVAHIEAGLRTGNIYSPWPEEMNRLLTSKLATYNFSPTIISAQNLLKENVSNLQIQVTGNTVIDSLHMVLEKLNNNQELYERTKFDLKKSGYSVDRLKEGRRLVLITGHRRENFGDGFVNICKAIKSLSKKYPLVDFVYPMHLNPNVRSAIENVFGSLKDIHKDTSLSNMFFIEPLDYLPFVFLMNQSYLILTDSGGIQEEAPGLGKPVLVMRDTTERPEAVSAGTVILVGTNKAMIENTVSELMDDQNIYETMSKTQNPYGDGTASKKIVEYFIKMV